MTAFLRWLTHAHVMGRRADDSAGAAGRSYRGRFRAFPVQADEHWYAALRHVERAPVRAGLVERAADWRYGSLACRLDPSPPGDGLSDGPVPRPADWLTYVNQSPPAAELAALRESEERGCPFGAADWQRETAARLGLESTLRPRGRPRKAGLTELRPPAIMAHGIRNRDADESREAVDSRTTGE